MGEVLNDLGKRVSKPELKYLFHQIDINGDGKITLDEFINGMARLQALSLFTSSEEIQEKKQEQEEVDYKSISQGLQMKLKSLEKLLKTIEKERAILQQELDAMRSIEICPYVTYQKRSINKPKES